MKTFHDVFPLLLAGKKIRRKGWEGFWAWENDTIVIHHGEEVFDIRETDNPQFTFGNIAADDWEIVTENVWEETKMGKIEFANAVVNKLAENGFDAEIVKVTKANDVHSFGVGVKVSKDARQVVYLDETYENVANNGLDDEQVNAVIDGFTYAIKTSLEKTTPPSVKSIEEWDKGNLIPVILREDWNREFLSAHPHKKIASDLAVYYRMRMHSIGTVPITYPLMEKIGLSEEELYETSVNNIRGQVRVQSLPGALNMLGWEGFELDPEKPKMEVIMTDGFGNYGAGAILCSLDDISDDAWLIPSSVHEWLKMENAEMRYEDVSSLIRAVNGEVISDSSEVLSDHPYRKSDFLI